MYCTGFTIRKLIIVKARNLIAQILGLLIEQTVSQKIISNRAVINNIGRSVLNLFTSDSNKSD